MRVGLMFDFRNPDPDRPQYEVLFKSRDVWIEAESLGFDAVVFTEHHGADDGYGSGLVPALAAAATTTHRMRIESAIAQLPLADPVTLADQLASVDQWAQGRLTVGVGAVGPGFGDEFAMVGRSATDRPGRFTEALELMVRCWTESHPFDHDGQFWLDRSGIKVQPKPVQQPHPPIWLAGLGQVGQRRAAQVGYGVGGRGGFSQG